MLTGMKPLIGINLDISAGPPTEAKVQSNYPLAVLKSGGIPILLYPMGDEEMKQVVARLDGLLFIGGLDYCPSRYGEEAHSSVEVIDPIREDWDFRLATHALTRVDLPILGICGGCQLLNISQGGSLLQDILTEHPGTQVQHSSPDGWKKGFHQHVVELVEGSKLAKLYPAKKVAVPTSHHQAVRKPGRGFEICAFAEDGVPEAVELTDRPFVIGVQWHPERDFETNRQLFEEFVKQCARAKAAVQ